MNLIDRLNEDLKTAMKNKDSLKLSVIRMVKGAISLEKIKLKRDLNDDEIIGLISKEIKMRKDSILEFEKANRIDLIDKNNEEIKILKEYLPEELSTEELAKIIDEVFILVNPSSTKDMGNIMKEITPRVKGRVDMSYVSNIVKDKLNSL